MHTEKDQPTIPKKTKKKGECKFFLFIVVFCLPTYFPLLFYLLLYYFHSVHASTLENFQSASANMKQHRVLGCWGGRIFHLFFLFPLESCYQITAATTQRVNPWRTVHTRYHFTQCSTERLPGMRLPIDASGHVPCDGFINF